MRALILTAVLALAAGVAAAEEPTTAWQLVYLNSPGAMERLKASNPERYRRIMSAAGVTEGGPHGLIEVASRTFNGLSAGLLLTTYPPQRNFEITLDNTTYRGRATVDVQYRATAQEYHLP
jgi:hypothetical protein